MFKKIINAVQNLLSGKDLYSGKYSMDGSSSYIDHGYIGVNNFLWKQEEHYGGFKGLEDTIKDIIGITENMNLTDKKLTLYRGTNEMLFPGIENVEKGIIIPFRGITSTSTDLEMANYFTQNNPRALEQVKPLIFKINVDKNKPHLQVGNLNEDEKEIILPPSLYEVVDVTTLDNGVKVVEINQKELLDVKDLMIEGLTHIEENIDSYDNIKPNHIQNLKTRVEKFYSHIDKNKTNSIENEKEN